MAGAISYMDLGESLADEYELRQVAVGGGVREVGAAVFWHHAASDSASTASR